MEKKKVPQNTVTRDIKNLAAPTGNIYAAGKVSFADGKTGAKGL